MTREKMKNTPKYKQYRHFVMQSTDSESFTRVLHLASYLETRASTHSFQEMSSWPGARPVVATILRLATWAWCYKHISINVVF